jgi:hypothetical protein
VRELVADLPEDSDVRRYAQRQIERLDRLGYASQALPEAFETWAGTENLEDRVAGVDRIDPVVLAELRKR